MLLFNQNKQSWYFLQFLISKHLMLLFNRRTTVFRLFENGFQNISCYCLTPVLTGNRKFLTIFQNISCYCLTLHCFWVGGLKIISKHLMLLFNIFRNYNFEIFHTFQNISCYCLTFTRIDSIVNLNFISKHLMLLFNI